MDLDLPTLKLDYKLFLDRSITLYGASGTGKSAIIIDILKQLKGHANQILVFSPTDPSNKTYSSGVVPTPLIHYEFDIELIERIWQRQEMMATAHVRANNFTIIETLFNKLRLTTMNGVMNRIRASKMEHINEIRDTYFDEKARKTKIAAIEEKYQELIVAIYKKTITDNKHLLPDNTLTPEERFVKRWMNLNPRLVLIFDDCASELKKFEKHPTVRKLFYQARHNKITLIIACQDDKDIESSLRKNSFISVFTTDACANAFFTRKANDFPKTIQKRVDLYCSAMRWDEPYFEKMVYVRRENKVYKFVAEIHEDFQFCSSSVRDYCRSIERSGTTMDKTNPFYGDFA